MADELDIKDTATAQGGEDRGDDSGDTSHEAPEPLEEGGKDKGDDEPSEGRKDDKKEDKKDDSKETDSDDDDLPEAPEEDKATLPKGFVNRLKREKEKRQEAELKFMEAQERLAAMSQNRDSGEIKRPAPASVPGLPPPPSRENYENDFDFVEAVNEYSAYKRNIIHQQRIAKENDRIFGQRLQSTLSDGSDVYEDFDNKVKVLFSDEFPSNRAMAEAIVDSDFSKDILYYYGKNPEKAKEIALMNPIKAVKEVAALEARFKARKSKNITGAKRPLEPLQGASGNKVSGGSAAGGGDPEKMDHESFVEWYEKKYGKN